MCSNGGQWALEGSRVLQTCVLFLAPLLTCQGTLGRTVSYSVSVSVLISGDSNSSPRGLMRGIKRDPEISLAQRPVHRGPKQTLAITIISKWNRLGPEKHRRLESRVPLRETAGCPFLLAQGSLGPLLNPSFMMTPRLYSVQFFILSLCTIPRIPGFFENPEANPHMGNDLSVSPFHKCPTSQNLKSGPNYTSQKGAQLYVKHGFPGVGRGLLSLL